MVRKGERWTHLARHLLTHLRRKHTQTEALSICFPFLLCLYFLQSLACCLFIHVFIDLFVLGTFRLWWTVATTVVLLWPRIAEVATFDRGLYVHFLSRLWSVSVWMWLWSKWGIRMPFIGHRSRTLARAKTFSPAAAEKSSCQLWKGTEAFSQLVMYPSVSLVPAIKSQIK